MVMVSDLPLGHPMDNRIVVLVSDIVVGVVSGSDMETS
jgi:hypothetical protein